MRVRFVAFLLLAGSWTSAQSPTSPAVTDRQRELVELARRRFQAFFEGDKAAYEKLVAKDAVFAYSNGRTLKYADALNELSPLAKAGTYTFHYEDVQFRDFGDSALLVYRLVFRGPPAVGGDYQGVESDTFVRRNNEWKLIAVHGSTIPYPNRISTSLPARLLNEYVGRFENAPGVYYDITYEGNQLMGQRNGFQKVPWFAESADIFFVPSDPTASRIFLRDSNGRVSKIVRIDVQGNTEWARASK